MKHKAKINPKTGRLEWEGPEPESKPDFLESAPAINNAYNELRPWESTTMACHPSQVKEFNESLEKRGLLGTAHYRRNGNFTTVSRQTRNAEMKFRQIADNEAGYGDHSGDYS